MLGESFIWSELLWYLNPPQNIYLKVNPLLDVPGNDFLTPKSHIHVVQLGHLWCTVMLFADFIKYFTSCEACDERQNFEGLSLGVFSKCRWCGDYFTGRSETTKTKMTINGVYLDHDHDRKLKLQL